MSSATSTAVSVAVSVSVSVAAVATAADAAAGVASAVVFAVVVVMVMGGDAGGVGAGRAAGDCPLSWLTAVAATSTTATVDATTAAAGTTTIIIIAGLLSLIHHPTSFASCPLPLVDRISRVLFHLRSVRGTCCADATAASSAPLSVLSDDEFNLRFSWRGRQLLTCDYIVRIAGPLLTTQCTLSDTPREACASHSTVGAITSVVMKKTFFHLHLCLT